MPSFKKSPLETVHLQLGNLNSAFENVKDQVIKVSKSLLSWSYGSESNPGLTHAFSCWADLDYAYAQLTTQLGDTSVDFRQVFKDILNEESKLKRLETKTLDDVKKMEKRIIRLRSSRENTQDEVLDTAQKMEDAAQVLKEKQDKFEIYKAKTLRDALIRYSTKCVEVTTNMLTIFKTKKEISDLMRETPVYKGERLPDANPIVQRAFRQINLQPPVGETALDRYQIRIPGTLPRQSPDIKPNLDPLRNMRPNTLPGNARQSPGITNTGYLIPKHEISNRSPAVDDTKEPDIGGITNQSPKGTNPKEDLYVLTTIHDQEADKDLDSEDDEHDYHYPHVAIGPSTVNRQVRLPPEFSKHHLLPPTGTNNADGVYSYAYTVPVTDSRTTSPKDDEITHTYYDHDRKPKRGDGSHEPVKCSNRDFEEITHTYYEHKGHLKSTHEPVRNPSNHAEVTHTYYDQKGIPKTNFIRPETKRKPPVKPRKAVQSPRTTPKK